MVLATLWPPPPPRCLQCLVPPKAPLALQPACPGQARIPKLAAYISHGWPPTRAAALPSATFHPPCRHLPAPAAGSAAWAAPWPPLCCACPPPPAGSGARRWRRWRRPSCSRWLGTRAAAACWRPILRWLCVCVCVCVCVLCCVVLCCVVLCCVVLCCVVLCCVVLCCVVLCCVVLCCVVLCCVVLCCVVCVVWCVYVCVMRVCVCGGMCVRVCVCVVCVCLCASVCDVSARVCAASTHTPAPARPPRRAVQGPGAAAKKRRALLQALRGSYGAVAVGGSGSRFVENCFALAVSFFLLHLSSAFFSVFVICFCLSHAGCLCGFAVAAAGTCGAWVSGLAGG